MKTKAPVIDQIIGYFSPKAGLERARARKVTDLVRGYDAASTYTSSDWGTARRSSGNAEVKVAQPILRDRSRDLVRNSPYANKAINVMVSNTVGAGIIPKIQGRNKSQEKLITAKWKQWAESTLCDRDSKFNFYGMQAAAFRSIIEGGEVIGKKGYYNGIAKIQLLEPDYINANISNNVTNFQGIWVDENTNQPIAYELYKNHPGDFRSYDLSSVKVPVSEIIHAYKIERLGQIRGVSWFYPVMNSIKDFSDYQNATLIRQKIASCLTVFITEKDGDSTLDPDTLKAQREAENMLEPGSIRYLAPGQNMEIVSPPGVDQYDAFARQTLRSIGAGLGISYESITGDYSQVNFSSGRMGHLEMQRNIDMWRWQLLIPQFCEPVFEFFLEWLKIQGIGTDGVTAQWTCPAREMIDPTKEIESLKNEVRSGFKSLPEAIRERGLDPDSVIQESAEFNQKLDDLGLIFDTDPRNMTAQGMAQQQPSADSAQNNNGDSNSGDTNKKNDT